MKHNMSFAPQSLFQIKPSTEDFYHICTAQSSLPSLNVDQKTECGLEVLDYLQPYLIDEIPASLKFNVNKYLPYYSWDKHESISSSPAMGK